MNDRIHSEADVGQHSRIVLTAETYMGGYEKLVFDNYEGREMRVVGEFVAVLG